LLAAFQVLIHLYTGQKDIIVGAPAVARGRPEFVHLVGYFVNMLALRADLSGKSTFRTFLGQVRRTVAEALEHQDFPFQTLVERLLTQRDPSRTPIFQVAFALQKAGAVETTSRLGELVLEPVELQRRAAHFDLDVTVHDNGGELCGAVEYSTDLFSADAVKLLWEHYQQL